MKPEIEDCIYCGKDRPMYYIPYRLREIDVTSGGDGYYSTKHEFEIRQCGFCKMIQPEDD